MTKQAQLLGTPDEPKSKSASTTWYLWTRIFSFLVPYRFWLALAILAASGQAGLHIGFAFLTRHLTDNALALQIQPFLSLLYLALALTVVGAVVTVTQLYTTEFYKLSALRDLREHVTGQLQQIPVAALEKVHSGDVVTRLNDDVIQIETFIGRIPSHVYQPILFIGAVTYMWLISWKLLLAIVVLIPISAVVFNRVSKPLEENNRQLQEKLAATNAFVLDVLGGLPIVKAFNLQELFTKKYSGIATDLQDKGVAIDRISAYLTSIWLALRFIPQLVLPLFGGYLMIQGELSVGSFLATTSLMWYVFQPVEALLDLLKEIRETRPAMERVLSFLDESTETERVNARLQSMNNPPLEPSNTTTSLTDGPCPIAFNQVSFAYSSPEKSYPSSCQSTLENSEKREQNCFDHLCDEHQVLEAVSFDLAPNEVVALVGASGAGKSTIIDLLCGFYEAKRGCISVFGQDIGQMPPSKLRQNLSLVAQESYLFPTTIAENIRYGRLDANQAEIVAAAQAANAHDFITAFPNGYETVVGERGSRLSGGQRQRIALARAILKDAPILLLDEPTAALDTQSESLVQEALERLMHQRSALVIAHRLSTIKRANRILVLDQGRIVESGSHESLMAQDGHYKKLYLKQVSA